MKRPFERDTRTRFAIMLSRMHSCIARGYYGIANGTLEVIRRLLWKGRRPQEAKRVVIYRVGNVGDIVCAVPAMVAIRRAYPTARLTLVTSPGKRGMPGALELLTGAEWLDDLWVYYADEIDTAQKRQQFVERLRREGCDVWFELPMDLASFRVSARNMIMAWLAGARWAYGWRINTIPWAARVQSEFWAFPNEVERLLLVISDAGIPAGPASFPLPVQDRHRQTVDHLLNQRGWLRAPLVAMAPAAKRSPNRWPADRFAEVGRFICRRGFSIAILGGERDALLCQQIAEDIGEGSLSVAGNLSLLECCELLRRCHVLVCNDSGVQHLAAAVGTSCISVFSCRDIRDKWSPYGAQHTVLRKWVACQACQLEQCPYDNRCINLIETKEVRAALDRYLASP